VDERAVAEAFRTYAPVVYARCVRLLRRRDAARDVTQEVFFRCLRERRGLRPGRELLAWLYRVATNLCLNLLRAEAIRRGPPLAEDSGTTQPAGPERLLVSQVLAGVDERTQAVAVYVLVDGMTHAEAAELAGVTDRTVRNCLTRFLAHARAVLGDDLEEAHDALSVRLRPR
jgi:RNA polymerase sigma-70 factor (ECF subfamily)